VTLQHFDNVTFDETLRAFPFAAMPFETITTIPVEGKLLESSTRYEYEVRSTNAGKTYSVFARQAETMRKENAQLLQRSWTTIDDVDESGNALDIRAGTDGVDLLERTYCLAAANLGGVFLWVFGGFNTLFLGLSAFDFCAGAALYWDVTFRRHENECKESKRRPPF